MTHYSHTKLSTKQHRKLHLLLIMSVGLTYRLEAHRVHFRNKVFISSVKTSFREIQQRCSLSSVGITSDPKDKFKKIILKSFIQESVRRLCSFISESWLRDTVSITACYYLCVVRGFVCLCLADT